MFRCQKLIGAALVIVAVFATPALAADRKAAKDQVDFVVDALDETIGELEKELGR